MNSTSKISLLLVTAPNSKVARQLARIALKARLIACANLVPKLESHYWWQGKIETSREVLMIMKTSRKHLRALEKLVVAKHPYDTPEFLALPLAGGSERYLNWIADSLAEK
jgi:periplasmic divalent cation tolerance protein